MKNKICKRENAAYLVSMAGQNMLYAVMSTGLSFYFQTVIFLPALAISAITILSKIIEFVSDPIMGHLIDRTDTKYGKCRPYLLFSPILICICSILVFVNGQYSSENAFAKNLIIIFWAGISSVLFGIVYSVGDVALWSYPSLITISSDDRNSLLANARIVSTISGSFIVLIVLQLSQYIGNLLSQKTGDNSTGLQKGTMLVCTIIIVIGSILFQMTGIFSEEKVKYSQRKISLKDSFSVMWSCKPFRLIMISGILRGASYVINTVQNVLFIYYFGNNGQKPYIVYMVICGGCAMGGQLISGFIMPKLVKKYSKIRLFVFSNIAASIAYFLVFVLYLSAPVKIADFVPFSIFSFLMLISGFFSGAVGALQSFMIGDAVDYEERKNNYRPDGIFFSGQSLLVKISMGISAVVSGIIYTAVGFSGDNISAVNNALYNGADFSSSPEFAEYRFAVFFMLSVVPAIAMLLSVLPMKKYFLYEDK